MKIDLTELKIALVHDWLTGMRGGEKCLEVFCELFPQADLFTLVHDKGKVSKIIEDFPIHTSFIQNLPRAFKKYRTYLPLFPMAIERLDLSDYDLIISSSHCVAKGIVPRSDALHLCYCFTPMRYVWDMYPHYFGEGKKGFISKLLIPPIVNYLRIWDVSSSARVDFFIAISQNVKRRIWKYYRREAEVIYPPVDAGFFLGGGKEEGYFLLVSALAPYKRIDLAIQAANQMGFRLLVIGIGPEERYLKKIAQKNVEFLGWQPPNKLKEYYAHCRAFIFPGEEDFGITPLEAMACGKPVIAYGRGGALETIIPLNGSSAAQPPTGVFFSEPNVDSLLGALRLYEQSRDCFNPRVLCDHARQFDRSIFKQKFLDFVEQKVHEMKPITRKGNGRA